MRRKIKEIKDYEKNPFTEWILNRIRSNKNCIIFVVGETGSGKSYSALRLAEDLDPNFTTDRITFSAKNFIRLVREDMPPGSVIMFDEGGVDIGNREFMTKKNRGLSKLLQTVRYKNHIIIVTVPDMKFIDTHARKLAHLIIRTSSIIKSEEKVLCRVYTIKTSALKGDLYYPHPMLKVNGQILKLSRVKISKPSVRLTHAYEKIKTEFGDNLYKEISNDYSESMDYRKELSEKEQTVFIGTKLGIEDRKLAEETGLNITTIATVRSRIRKKGFNIPYLKKKSIVPRK